MRGKRGWLRILEATIAVLIVAVTMITVYSGQFTEQVDDEVHEYVNGLQREILSDISDNRTLRIMALSVEEDYPGDENYDKLLDFVSDNVPNSFGYLLRVCDLGDDQDFCKMDGTTFLFTITKNVYVEDTVIGAEVGDGTDAVYSPKKVRLFFWEGGFPNGFCLNECPGTGTSLVCNEDATQVLNVTCGDYDDDVCYEYGADVLVDNCDGADELCYEGECVVSEYAELTCYAQVDVFTDCVWGFDNDCQIQGRAFGMATGDCGFLGQKTSIKCWNVDYQYVECSENPVCPSGYSLASKTPCIPECVPVWTPAASSVCAGETFEQTDGCGNSQSAVGTKSCAAAVASLNLGFSNINYQWINPNHYYYHTRTFTETNGVGVTLTSGSICYGSGGCSSGVVNYNIPANGNLVLNGQNFYTSYPSETFILTYYGADANGNSISIQKTVNVAGSSWLSP